MSKSPVQYNHFFFFKRCLFSKLSLMNYMKEVPHTRVFCVSHVSYVSNVSCVSYVSHVYCVSCVSYVSCVSHVSCILRILCIFIRFGRSFTCIFCCWYLHTRPIKHGRSHQASDKTCQLMKTASRQHLSNIA